MPPGRTGRDIAPRQWKAALAGRIDAEAKLARLGAVVEGARVDHRATDGDCFIALQLVVNGGAQGSGFACAWLLVRQLGRAALCQLAILLAGEIEL